MPIRKYRSRRGARKAPMRGRGRASYRKRAATSALHGVKKFVCLMKLRDVIAPAHGAVPDGIQVYNMKFKYSDLPLASRISALYRQVALTGVKVEYRTTNPTPTNVATGVTTATVAHPSVNCYYTEDKDTETDLTATQFKSQDNAKRLVSHRNFGHYVRNPRPALYQMDGAGNRLKTIDSGNQIHWISTNSTYGVDLLHLHSQFAVEELPDTVPNETEGQKQGELWMKVYLIAKEQNSN